MLIDYPGIKQIMPLPDGYTALTPTIQSSSATFDERKSLYDDRGYYGSAHCLALVHHEDGFDYVCVYEADPEGIGDLQDHAILAPIKNCPKCGERMFIYMEDGYSEKINYACNCGTTFELNRKCPVPHLYKSVGETLAE